MRTPAGSPGKPRERSDVRTDRAFRCRSALFLRRSGFGGRLSVGVEVVSRDGDLATLDGTLMDHTGTVVATATAGARVVHLDDGPKR